MLFDSSLHVLAPFPFNVGLTLTRALPYIEVVGDEAVCRIHRLVHRYGVVHRAGHAVVV